MKYQEQEKRTSGTHPACWAREAHCACLRVCTSDTDAHLLPYQHFVNARLSRAEGKEKLIISFSTHDVVIEGSNLGEIFDGLQSMDIKWLRAAPERYHALVPADAAVIGSVSVSEIDET